MLPATRRSVAAWLVAATASTSGTAAEVYVQRNMAPLVEAIHADPVDIGDPAQALDGDASSLVRSAAVNPFTISFTTKEPLPFDRVRIRTSDDEHRWTMETADSQRDMENRTGSYRRVVDGLRSAGPVARARLEAPAKASVFRLTIERLTGDDYVHLFEWEFPVPVPLRDLRVLVLDYYPRGPERTPASEIAQNTVVSVQAFAVPDTGPELDVTPEAEWDVEGEPWGDRPGRYLVREPGSAAVRASYGGITREVVLTVVPATIENRKRDLNVLFIERLPRLDYDAPNGGWPVEGAPVTWRAHVHNWGTQSFDRVSYAFRLDDRVVAEDVIEDFRPGTERTVDWPWSWTKTRRRIEFEVDPVGEIDEFSEANNRVRDLTDALAVGFYVEEGLWNYLHDTQPELHIGSNSFADWAQRQMHAWNELHERAVFASCPRGVLDRVRLDRLVLVPNNALPMAGGIATNNPNNDDKTVDLIWGFESNDLRHGGWKPVDTTDENANYISWGHIHELNHARYIIDHYGFDVHPPQVHVTLDDGTPLAGSAFFPEGMLHPNSWKGLMGGGGRNCDEYMALAWNRVAGQRARGGNYNSPEVIGEYMDLFPEENTLQFVAADGAPLAGGRIRIYRSEPREQGFYNKHFDDVPDLDLALGDLGQARLGKTIFAEDARLRHGYEGANTVVIVRADHQDRLGFAFIECADFNVESMRGHTAHGHYTVTVPMRSREPGNEEAP